MLWKIDDARQTQHPDAPWRWREEWESGTLEGSPRGLGALLAGGRYGTVRLALPGGLVAIGRECAGRIEIEKGAEFLDLARPVRCVLTCIHRRESGSGKNRSVSLIQYWRDERDIMLERSGHGAVAAYRCGIPADRPATTMGPDTNRIYWELRITQEVPGADLDFAFALPVFLVDDATLAATVGESLAAELAVTPELAPTAPDGGDGMRFERRGDGFQLHVAPRRHVGMATVLTVMALIFSVAGIFVGATGSPVFGGLLLLIMAPLWYAALRLWFREVTVVATARQLAVGSRMLGIRRERTVTAEALRHVYLNLAMASGDTGYWDVRAVPKEGAEFTVVPSMPDESAAKFVVLALAATLGVPVAPAQRLKVAGE